MLIKPGNSIDVENLSKKFARNHKVGREQLKNEFVSAFCNKKNRNGNLRSGEFWALKDLSFELRKGEVLGVIGVNGSGKSTLLKCLEGLYLPDKGAIKTMGEIGSFVDLSAGFDTKQTGRENIFIKGAILGKSREEMLYLYEEIVEFSELGDFINTPVKNYSTGMQMRLAFSIAITIDPDILLMDEVFAVGDFRFRQKCQSRMNDKRENMSIVFVSHALNNVRLFCDRVLVLDHGEKVFDGEPTEAIKFYKEEIEEFNNQHSVKKKLKDDRPYYGDLFINEDKIYDVEHFWANKDLNKIIKCRTGEEVNMVVKFKMHRKASKDLVAGFPIWNSNSDLVSGIATDMDDYELIGNENNEYELILNFEELCFNAGEYTAVFSLVDGMEFVYRGLFDKLEVVNPKRNVGFVTANHRWYQNGKYKSKF